MKSDAPLCQEEGEVFFSADYSQIELRVLAHISGDPHMKQAFLEGQDIHAATARRVFGLAEDEAVNSDMRRQAKAVNFGIVYGISDYGLSQNLDMPRKEAKALSTVTWPNIQASRPLCRRLWLKPRKTVMSAPCGAGDVPCRIFTPATLTCVPLLSGRL